MSASRTKLPLLAGLSLAVLAAHVAAQPDERDILYAEHMPLAPASLLLDALVTADGSVVAVGERGHVVRSQDGKSWEQATAVPTRSTLTSITAAGNRLWAAGHDSVIITSGDGGLTWTRQYYDPDRQQPIMDIQFLDEERGIAAGAYGLFLVTYDGGQTWEDGYVSDEEWHLNAITPLGDGRLFMAGEAGYSYISTDEGETWELLELPYQGSMWGAVGLADGCILAFGLRGHVQQSCDEGESWQELQTGTLSSLSGGIAVGDRVVLAGNSGTIVERVGGGPFTATLHPSGVDFAAVLDRGNGQFLLLGEDGVHAWPTGASGGAGQ